ncbi:MAG: septum formation initiator family protein [Verrucomicrobium sp.]
MPEEEFGYDDPSTDRPNFLTRLVRLNRYLLALLVIPAGVIYFRPPLKEQEAARHRLEELTAKRDILKADATRLQTKLELIKTDPEYLETMARDRLNLQKDGEIILRFEDP